MPKKQPNMENAMVVEAAKWVEPARKLKKGSKVRNAAEAFDKQEKHAWKAAARKSTRSGNRSRRS